MFQRQRIGNRIEYLADESKMTGRADNLLAPYDEQELREILRVYNSKKNPVTVSGMRTGVSGGSVPAGGDVLSMEHMAGVTGIGKDGRGYFLRVLPCTTLDEIDRVLRTRNFSSLADITPGACGSLAKEPCAYFYPVDPTETGSSVGGNIATNASGPRTYRYGPTRNWVRRIRAVLADSSVADITRGEYFAEGRRMSMPAGRNYFSFDIPDYDFNTSVKNSAGPCISGDMDLIDLFIGSEGIFGVISEADIYIIPRHPSISLILFFPDDASALAAARDIRAGGKIRAEFLEYLDSSSVRLIRDLKNRDPLSIMMPRIPESAGSALFFDIPDDGDTEAELGIVTGIAERHGSSAADSWCGSDEADKRRMKEFRHAVPKTIFEYVASLKGTMPGIHKLGSDMSVPDDRSEEMMAFYRSELDAAGLEYCMFGHIGNNHPHVEIILKSEEEFETAKKVYERFAGKAVGLGGSASAEHGIGKLKIRYMHMMYGDEGVEALRRVKSILDPNWILSPGNMIGDRK